MMIDLINAEMKLHVQSEGRGPDVVLLHGWGMHSGIWDEVLEELVADFRVHRVDLPGHGQSPLLGASFELETVADEVFNSVAPQINDTAVFIGWSLGGVIALQLALRYPAYVNKLILVASTPRFAKADDWPYAIDKQVLLSFSQDLQQDYSATLQRFLALQIKGDSHARAALRLLRERILSCDMPDVRALQGGLDILSNTDLRQAARALALPVVLINGERDMLIPVAAVAEVARLLPNSLVRVIAGAGHAPFISHRTDFIDILNEFLNE